MRLALFDLDNTLLSGDSDYEWGQFLVDHGVLERERYEAQNRAYYEQYVAGALDIHEYLAFALAPLAAQTPEALTRPVAVDPDEALAAVAARRGWAVMSLRR